MSGYKYSECMLHRVCEWTRGIVLQRWVQPSVRSGWRGGAQYANPDLVKTARVGATHMVVAVS